MWNWIGKPTRKWLLILLAPAMAVTGIVLTVGLRGAAATWFASYQRERDELAALAQGRSFLEKGLPSRAFRAVARIRAGGPHEAEALTIKGMVLASLEETGPARQVLERAWQLGPSGDAARFLAAIYLSSYENERGLQMLIEASRLDPADFRPWYAMGESVYLRLRYFDLAIRAFRESLKRQPDHLESRIGLIEALMKAHRAEEADSLAAQVLPHRPDDPRLLALAGELALQAGRQDEAARHLSHALAINPNHQRALVLHAQLLFSQRRPNDALPETERACSVDPNDLEAITFLSAVQASLGLKDEAERTLAQRKAIRHRAEQMEALSKEILNHPDLPELRWRLGQLAAEGNMISLAIQSYLGALAHSPTFEPARKALLDLSYPPSRLPPAPHARRSDNRN
ncbi:MAG: tetratricopeptide repeat protein [Isosphaeraceae bacterium]